MVMRIHTWSVALRLLLILSVLLGIAYPLVVTALGSLFWPAQAGGSLLPAGDRPLGSRLVGQPCTSMGWFWSRPSATAPVACTAFDPGTLTGSSGANQGPLHPALREAQRHRVAALRAADRALGIADRPIPVDLVTASGSGLDPHISPAAAEFQVPRVARSRGLTPSTVRDLVARHTRGPQFGFLGEPVVEVLPLNLALQELARR